VREARVGRNNRRALRRMASRRFFWTCLINMGFTHVFSSLSAKFHVHIRKKMYGLHR